MKSLITKKYGGVLALLGFLGIFLSCQNPMGGLGLKPDLDTPTIRILENGEVINGSYVKQTFTISGTYTDDKEIASVGFTFTDTASMQVSDPYQALFDDNLRTWSIIDFNTNQISPADRPLLFRDGEKQFILTVTDKTGKTNETRFLLFFDNRPSTIFVDDPSETQEYNGDVLISGMVYDPFGVKKVNVTVFKEAEVIVDNAQADGTNRFTYYFPSATYAPAGKQEFTYQVTATDRAGNLSTKFYKYKSLYDALGKKDINIDRLDRVLAGETFPEFSLSQTEFQELGKTSLTLKIDQDSDKPQFETSVPQVDDILGLNTRAVGLVSDDDGIDGEVLDSVEIMVDKIAVDGTLTVMIPWSPVTLIGTGLNVRWQYSLDSLSEAGSYQATLRAKDKYGKQSITGLIPFKIDSGIPAINLDLLDRVYFNQGEIIPVTGTAESVGGAIDQVLVNLAGYAVQTAEILTGAGTSKVTWKVNLALTGAGEGARIIQAKAYNGNKFGISSQMIILDNTNPTPQIISPSSDSTVYGEVVLRGTNFDNSSLSNVELQIGKAGGWVELTSPGSDVNKYDWNKTFLANDYANSTQSDAHSTESGVWVLPIKVRVTDVAQNITTLETYKLNIDLDRDKPLISIITPADGINLAGSVLISGTAMDESPGLQKVEAQIEALQDDNTLIGFVTAAGGASDASTWIAVNGTTYWQLNINDNEKLYSVTSLGGAWESSGKTHNGRLRISLRSQDGNNKYSNISTRTIRLDNSIPRVVDFKINGVPAQDYLQVKGPLTLTATLTDDLKIEAVQLSLNGSAFSTDLIGSSYLTKVSDKEYQLSITIDSLTGLPALTGTTMSSSLLSNKAGLLTLGIKVKDNASPSPYTTSKFVTLNLDNKFPTGTYGGTTYHKDPQDLYGNKVSSAVVSGVAVDTGAVNGIQKVQVYFTNPSGTQAYNLSTYNETFATVPTDFGNGADLAPMTTNPLALITIDSSHNRNDHKKALEPEVGGVHWVAYFDSTKIPDGPVLINYILEDKAGNKTYGSQTGFIKNYKPVITSITTGADLNFSGAVEVGEQFTYTGIFNARNNLYLKINASDDGSLTYYVLDGGTPVSGAPSGGVNEGTVDISGLLDQEKTYTLRVTDNVGISVEQPFSFSVAQTDSEAPTLGIDVLTQSDVSLDLGHLESAADNPFNRGIRPAVSGTLTLKGSAHDSNRIKELRISLDGEGIDVLLAEWDSVSKTLISKKTGFTITSQDLNVTDGHRVTWSYLWDTSTITNKAQLNIPLTLSIQDFRSGSPAAVSAASTFDVVPYISRVTTKMSAAFSNTPSAFSRSTSGNYPIMEGETVKIYGYNFNGASTMGEIETPVNATALQTGKKYRIAFIGTTDFSTLGAASNTVGLVFTKNATPGTGTGGASPIMDMVLQTGYLESLPHSASGNFKVVVNGVSSINNLITPIHTWNQEKNSYNNDLLTDHRGFVIWTSSVVRLDGTVRYPVMKISPTATQEVGWAFDQSENNFYMTQRGNAPARFSSNPTRYYHTAFTFDQMGNTYGAGQSGDISAGGGTISGWSSATVMTYRPGSQAGTYMGGYRDGTNQNRILQLTSDGTSGNTDSERFRSPQVIASLPTPTLDPDDGANKTVVYLSYYDSILDAIRLRIGGVGSDDGDALIDGDLSDRYPANGADYGYVAGSTETTGAVTISTTGSVAKPGKFTAMALSGSVLLMSWYDQTARKLWFSYNTDPVNDGSVAQWQTHAITIDNDNAGWYVDMKVDSAEGIHLSYFNSSNGDLRYAYLSRYDDITPDVVTVDSFLSVGQNASIDVKWNSTISKYVPYISYQMGTFISTPYSLKIAYRSDFTTSAPLAGVGSDKYTGAWEIMSVPIQYAAKDFRVSMGFKNFNGITNQPIIGYATEETLEYSQMR